jgi:hypothetical protein
LRYYIYVEPLSSDSSLPVYIIMSEEAVLAEEGAKFNAKYKTTISIEDELTRKRLIENWCIVHWASELTTEFIDKTFFNHGQ